MKIRMDDATPLASLHRFNASLSHAAVLFYCITVNNTSNIVRSRERSPSCMLEKREGISEEKGRSNESCDLGISFR